MKHELGKKCRQCRYHFRDQDSEGRVLMVCFHEDAAKLGTPGILATAADGHCGESQKKYEPLRLEQQ